MLPTIVAPTSTSTQGRGDAPAPSLASSLASSNTQTTRSLRANSPGTPRTVAGFTE